LIPTNTDNGDAHNDNTYKDRMLVEYNVNMTNTAEYNHCN